MKKIELAKPKQKFCVKKIIAYSAAAIVFAVVFFFGAHFNFAVAADAGALIEENTAAVGEAAGLPATDPILIVARIIRAFIGFLGVVALILVIYGGYLYMTSAGEKEKAEKARKLIVNAFIGLAIILSAFAIVSFIISRLMGALGDGTGTDTPRAYVSPGLGSGALGSGPIQDHFPGVGMTVPRNTVIMVTFKEAITPSSIMDNIICKKTSDNSDCSSTTVDPAVNCICKGILKGGAAGSVQIYKACDSIVPAGETPPAGYGEPNRANPDICNEWKATPPDQNGTCAADDTAAEAETCKFVMSGDVTMTPDFKTFIFNPYSFTDNHLGSPLNDVGYIVKLTNSITKLDNSRGIFTGFAPPTYSWDFKTNTTIDVTPPFVVNVYPVDLDAATKKIPLDGTVANAKARNNGIRIDFSEAVIPPMALALPLVTPAPDNREIFVTGTIGMTTTNVRGNLLIGNGYRSVVFKSDMACGTGDTLNSCGERVFCLPGDARIDTRVHSVPIGNLLNDTGPGADTFPAGGMVDAALNALDTNHASGIKLGVGNGRTEGADDDFFWNFRTSQLIDLTPPIIQSVTPFLGAQKSDGVTPDVYISAIFDKEINPASATNSNLQIFSERFKGWFTGGLCVATATGTCTADPVGKQVFINHADLPEAKTAADVPLIFPKVKSGLQDMTFNCFNPCKGPGATCGTGLSTGTACCSNPPPGSGDMSARTAAPLDVCPEAGGQ
jgi:cbb3-type cytochrome oxidase subunit 3